MRYAPYTTFPMEAPRVYTRVKWGAHLYNMPNPTPLSKFLHFARGPRSASAPDTCDILSDKHDAKQPWRPRSPPPDAIRVPGAERPSSRQAELSHPPFIESNLSPATARSLLYPRRQDAHCALLRSTAQVGPALKETLVVRAARRRDFARRRIARIRLRRQGVRNHATWARNTGTAAQCTCEAVLQRPCVNAAK